MRRVFCGALALTILAAGCAGHASARSRVTELREVEVIPGANKIDTFVADGRSGLITEGWRDLGSGRGYRIYSVLIPNTNPLRGWDIVPVEPLATDTGAQETAEIAGSVRFARGWLDGTPTTFVITAKRDGDGTKTHFGFDVYKLSTARSGTGESENAFEPVLHTVSKAEFCNPDLALAREYDLPLPSTYTGLKTPDGCAGGASG